MATKKTATKKKEKAPKIPRETQNGITRPADNTTSSRVWAVADHYTKETGVAALRSDVVGACTNEGINPSTASTQYGRWRRFNGLVGTGSSKKSETPKEEAA